MKKIKLCTAEGIREYSAPTKALLICLPFRSVIKLYKATMRALISPNGQSGLRINCF